MRNIDRCSCGCGGETNTEIPGTPGPDGEDFVDNDYLFATQCSPEWYDGDEHAKRRYVQPDPEVNEYVYSVTEEACQDEQCGEPCEEAPDCKDACVCGGTSGDCSAVCDACGCSAESGTMHSNEKKSRFDACRAREESIRRNQARAAQRRTVLRDNTDADERIRRRENALRQSAPGKKNDVPCETQTVMPEPELSCLPADLYVSPEICEAEYPAAPNKKEKKTWPEIPVFDLGPVCGFPGNPCEPQQEDTVTENECAEETTGLQELYVPAEAYTPYRPQNPAAEPVPQSEYDIYGKADRFANETIENPYSCDCSSNDNRPEDDGCNDTNNGSGGTGGGEDCECCCKGEDCYAPDYYACELDEDCCAPESAYLMQGSFGDEVRAVQRCIKSIPEEQGGTSSLEVDGIYGPNTAIAVMRFQEQHDIPADGVTNKKTRARMKSLCQSR